jgi:hypothetical protein
MVGYGSGDPSFFVNADPVTDPDPDPAEKNYIILIENYILLISRPPQRTPKLQEKSSSLKREHLVLQN